MTKQENKILYQSFPKKTVISQLSLAILSENETLVLSLIWLIIVSKMNTPKKPLISKEVRLRFKLFFIFVGCLLEIILFPLSIFLQIDSIEILISGIIALVFVLGFIVTHPIISISIN
jgi:hypothetical protein